MAGPIEVKISQALSYFPEDTIELEVDSVAQLGRLEIWGAERQAIGFGRGTFGTGAFGFDGSIGLGFGVGAFGTGPFGIDERIVTRQTRKRFSAGDYTVRARAIDELGNIGDWSASKVYEHRPVPETPTDCQLSDGTLTWSWSDP